MSDAAPKKAKPRFTGDRRLIQKAKDRKVAKYKIYKNYKQALRDDAANAETSGLSDINVRIAAAIATDPDATDADIAAAAAPMQRSKKVKKVSAIQAARFKWEKKEAERQAERDTAEAAKAKRQSEIESAKKRRSDQLVKHMKRTKRGQPVLGNQVEVLLARIQKGN